MTRRLLLILSALAFLFASCNKKGGNSGLLVPKDAAFVVHINSASLSSKLSWNEIGQTNWFKEMSKEATDTFSRQLLADPASSGIDTKKDFVFYLKKHGQGGYFVFEGSLTDAAAYEKTLKQMNKKETKEIKKEGEFSYMLPDEKSAVIWNKSMFAVVANATMPDMTKKFTETRRPEKYVFQNDSLKIFGQQALTLEGGDNLDTDNHFADLVKDGSDMHMWMNLSQYTGMGNAMLSMMKMNTLLEKNITAMSLNFDKGKITVKSKHYFGDQMNDILANNKPLPVSADVINRIPSSNVVAVLAFNYSPTGLKEILKMTGVDAIANVFLSKVDFSIDEFVKANKGEVLLAVSDPAKITKMDTLNFGDGKPHIYPVSKTDMKILFATSVNDKAAFEKMVTLAWDISKKSGRTDRHPISYKLQNNWFAASNAQEYTDKFLAGSNAKLPFTDKITGHPFGIYIDLQKIMLFAQSEKKDSSKAAAIAASLNMWEDIVARGGDYKDKAAEFEVEINLVDKNTNSLKQLNQYFDKMLFLEKMKKGRVDVKEVTLTDISTEEEEPPPPPPPPAKKKASHK